MITTVSKRSDATTFQDFDSSVGLSYFETSFNRPLDPKRLSQLFDDVQLRKLIEAPVITDITDDGLLPDQRSVISLTTPIKVLIKGGGGHLAGGFLAKGATNLEKIMSELGAAGMIQYVLCDVFPTQSEKAKELVSKRRAQGYVLSDEQPYICTNDLNWNTIRKIAPDFCIAATPPKIHCDNALEAMMMGIHTYVEKPAYRAGFGNVEHQAMKFAITKGDVDLIDFFLYNRAYIEFLSNPFRFISGAVINQDLNFGDIRYIHSTCIEPHLAQDEGPRSKMLMDYETSGGYLWVDQGSHTQATLEAVLMALCNKGLAQSELAMSFRGRSIETEGPQDAETSAAVLSLFKGDSQGLKGPIELMSVVGKGLKINGGGSDTPQCNYMLTLGCEQGLIEICIGNFSGTIPSYIALTPHDTSKPMQILKYPSSGFANGYSLFLADAVIEAQSKQHSIRCPSPTSPTLERLKRQTFSALAGMENVEKIQNSWQTNLSNLQRSGPGMQFSSPILPSELPLACRIHGGVEC